MSNFKVMQSLIESIASWEFSLYAWDLSINFGPNWIYSRAIYNEGVIVSESEFQGCYIDEARSMTDADWEILRDRWPVSFPRADQIQPNSWPISIGITPEAIDEYIRRYGPRRDG